MNVKSMPHIAFNNLRVNGLHKDVDSYARLFENNKKWAKMRLKEDPDFFKRSVKAQTPEFLYVGCSDSRVNANEIMGLQPGELFVHRNIANLVVNTDTNVQSVIQYAVEFLHVKHIIVCGHYGCGGVRAAMQSRDLGLLNGWLREIRDIYRIHKEELDAIKCEEKRYNRLIELNVQEQCVNIIKTSWVEKPYYRYGYPIVHGMVYDMSNGKLVDLNINFESILENIKQIYNLDKGV